MSIRLYLISLRIVSFTVTSLVVDDEHGDVFTSGITINRFGRGSETPPVNIFFDSYNLVKRECDFLAGLRTHHRETDVTGVVVDLREEIQGQKFGGFGDELVVLFRVVEESAWDFLSYDRHVGLFVDTLKPP